MTVAPRILIVDDDVDLAVLLSHVLRLEGHDVRLTHGGHAALSLIRQEEPDLVVLDLGLPDLAGNEVCRRIRQRSRVPVIMLTAAAEEDVIVAALDGGADDYITKPFRPRQLLARIRAVLRRAGVADTADAEQLTVGPISVDIRSRQVRCHGRVVSLTPIEFQLLHYLALHAGRVLTFSQIIEHVWGFESSGDEGLVRVHVSRLRKKLGLGPSEKQLLLSFPRVGYSLAA